MKCELMHRMVHLLCVDRYNFPNCLAHMHREGYSLSCVCVSRPLFCYSCNYLTRFSIVVAQYFVF